MIKFGLKGAFAPYLTVLSRYPEGITSSRLSEICDKDKSAVSRVISEMAQKGLVKREGTKDNLYRATITLTANGAEVASFVKERAMSAVAAASKGLSEENRLAFYSALQIIASNLREISKIGIPE
jgi:DNA-binding MarR family transcriptional regulator